MNTKKVDNYERLFSFNASDAFVFEEMAKILTSVTRETLSSKVQIKRISINPKTNFAEAKN